MMVVMSPMPDDAERDDTSRYVAAVLAVKALGQAKSRLAAGRPLADTAMGRRDVGEARREAAHRGLVLSMLLDTMAAVRDAGIVRIVVVSPDDDVLDAVARVGAIGLREPSIEAPAPNSTVQNSTAPNSTAPNSTAQNSTAPGLNGALAHGARRAIRDAPHIERILFLQADLPAATGEALGEVLAASSTHRQAFVADHAGDGTALLIRDSTIVEPTRFGPESAERHRRAGATELDPGRRRWVRLRTDVDTIADLEAALRLGVGARTAATLADTDPGSGLIARARITDEPNAS